MNPKRHAPTIEVNLAQISGRAIRAWWYNPREGTARPLKLRLPSASHPPGRRFDAEVGGEPGLASAGFLPSCHNHFRP